MIGPIGSAPFFGSTPFGSTGRGSGSCSGGGVRLRSASSSSLRNALPTAGPTLCDAAPTPSGGCRSRSFSAASVRSRTWSAARLATCGGSGPSLVVMLLYRWIVPFANSNAARAEL